MRDNTTAHNAGEYDEKVPATIPFYNQFHLSAIDLVNAVSSLTTNRAIGKWLDTGCGTGAFCLQAKKVFGHTAFTLADPSPQMLEAAKDKLKACSDISFIQADSQSLDFNDNTFDVVSAIQCHHYLDKAGRIQAVHNCCRMLKDRGIFITFENIMPLSPAGQPIGLKRWENAQIRSGKTPGEAKEHILRFNQEYFPITIPDHIQLLRETGFRTVEILWSSFMQAGFYAIK